MPIETIIFDLGQTLVPFSFAGIQPRFAHATEAARVLMQQAEVGELSAAEFQRQACVLTGVAAEAFPEFWNSIFEPQWLIAPAVVRDLLSEYRVGLLSNTNALHYEYLEREHPLLRQFHFRILSHEVGAAKPAAAIYAAAEAAAGCPPEAIFYLDDMPEFVAAAQARGWRAVQFTGAAALPRQFDAHGIKLRGPAVSLPRG